jgi:hypothetical protein
MAIYFERARTHITDSADDQLKFFIEMKIDSLLTKWLPEVVALFPDELRTLAFALFRILVNNSMLVACVKTEDSNVGSPQMARVFKLIPELLTTISPLLAQLNPSQKQILVALQNDVTEESKRIERNNENKPAYKTSISKITEILKTIVV